MVRLTSEGRAALARLIPSAQAITEATLAPLTPPERAEFIALLERLG